VIAASGSRSRDDPASIPRMVPVGICRLVPGDAADDTTWYAPDHLGPSEKRKVGAMDVPSRAGHMLVTNLSTLDITVDI
jgi:hypothetical protein